MDFMTTMYNFGIKDEIDTKLPGKTFNAYRNGNPDALLRLKVKDQYDSEEIVRYLKQKFKFKAGDRLRLFNAQGVEIYPDDFKYMKDDASIFVSKGEGFDKSSTLSEYIMMRKLGEGTFGEVHLAAHKSSKQMVAIKFLKKPKQADAAGADRFFLEVEILKALSHKNIIKIINCFTMKDMQIAIVMEYLEGGTLLNYVKNRKRLPEDEAKRFFTQMIEAVSYCHANKVIHCDLKLENILLDSETTKNIKIIDFGISGLKTHFKSKIAGGSLHHMCPESITGNKKYVHSGIDVWALGCMLYEMLCGKWAFFGEDSKKITESICKGKFSFGSLRNFLSNDVKNLITRMLEKDPAKRITIAGILNHPWMNQPTQGTGEAQRKFFRLDSNIVAQINGTQKPVEEKTENVQNVQNDSGSGEDEDDILSNL